MPLQDCIVFFPLFTLYETSTIVTQSSQTSHDHEVCVCDKFLKHVFRLIMKEIESLCHVCESFDDALQFSLATKFENFIILEHTPSSRE